MMTLAYGVRPIRAVGMAMSLWFILLLDTALVTKCWRWLGDRSFKWRQFGNLPLALLVSLVLLGNDLVK